MIKIRRSDVPLLKLMYGEASRFYDTDLYMKNIEELKQAEREMKEGESTDFDVTGVQALRSQAKRTADMLEKIRDLKKKAVRSRTTSIDRTQSTNYKRQSAWSTCCSTPHTKNLEDNTSTNGAETKDQRHQPRDVVEV